MYITPNFENYLENSNEHSNIFRIYNPNIQFNITIILTWHL